jgi:CRP/FNR family transcriptional regulator, cyclic AMP receptor protein
MKVEGVFRSTTVKKTFPAGTVIFAEGAAGEEMYGVIEGRVSLRRGDDVLAELGPDEVFGEMAMVDHSSRSRTAVAEVDTVLAVIDRHSFLFLVHETPMFAIQVMSTLAERLRARDES